MKAYKPGFTIVELLIVIVVIGILAAITIVAFNGVQERTRNAKTISAVKEIAKIYQSYAVDHGTYPGAGSNYCIGTDYEDGLCWDNRTYTENTFANTAMLTVVSKIPQPSTTRVYRNSTDGSRAGILFVNPNNLRYQLEGNTTECGLPGATRAFTNGPTGPSSGPECNYTMPTPN